MSTLNGNARASMKALVPMSVILMGGGKTGANFLLRNEPQGMAIDFTVGSGVGSVAVKDATTHANNLSNVPADSFLTQSGTSPKLVLWSDGLYRWTGHNFFSKSQEFEHADWGKTAGIAATANTAIAPDGTLTADSLTASATGFIYARQVLGSIQQGMVFTQSVYAKAGTGTKLVLGSSQSNSYVEFDLNNGTKTTLVGTVITSAITSVGDGWYRCSMAYDCGTTLVGFEIKPQNTIGTEQIYIWGAQLQRGQTLQTYHVTTAAAWYGVPIEYDPTTAKFHALVEPLATNLALYASDFTNAAWVKSNMTTALTATGPDGVANSASTLTATAGNATALQAITSASASRVTSMFVKRRTGSGVVNLTQDNGGTWIAVTVTAGWTNVPLAAVTSANPTVGIRIVTSADAVDVAWFQHELAASGSAAAIVTSPVPTFSATVTRGKDLVALASSSFPNSVTGTWSVLYTPSNPAADFHYIICRNNGDGPFLYYNPGGGAHNATAQDGASILAVTNATTFNAQNRVTAAYDGVGTQKIALNGGAVSSGAYTPPALADIALGYRGGPGDTTLKGRLHKIVFVPRMMTDAQMQAALQ